MSHTFYPSVHTFLVISVLCHGSLVWHEASGFPYSIDTGPPLGLLLQFQLSNRLLIPYNYKYFLKQSCSYFKVYICSSACMPSFSIFFNSKMTPLCTHLHTWNNWVEYILGIYIRDNFNLGEKKTQYFSRSFYYSLIKNSDEFCNI